jgi:hypothetical protein
VTDVAGVLTASITALMMDAVNTSETSVGSYQITPPSILEDIRLQVQSSAVQII